MAHRNKALQRVSGVAHAASISNGDLKRSGSRRKGFYLPRPKGCPLGLRCFYLPVEDRHAGAASNVGLQRDNFPSIVTAQNGTRQLVV